MTQEIPMHYFLILSSILFFTGICGFIIRRNLLTMLMAIELILNSVNINFIVFNRYLYPNQMEGLFFTLIIVAVAAAETAVAIALIINVYRHFASVEVEDVDELKH